MKISAVSDGVLNTAVLPRMRSQTLASSFFTASRADSFVKEGAMPFISENTIAKSASSAGSDAPETRHYSSTASWSTSRPGRMNRPCASMSPMDSFLMT